MSETVVSGLVPTALAGILLLGIVAVSLRRLLMSILEARQTAMRELDRAHSFVRLLYIAQAICFCNVLVTAWSSPPLQMPAPPALKASPWYPGVPAGGMGAARA